MTIESVPWAIITFSTLFGVRMYFFIFVLTCGGQSSTDISVQLMSVPAVICVQVASNETTR